MARTLNLVQLIGRLGADPELRYTSAGLPVTTFSLATNRQWTGKDGDLREETDWHSIVAWDKLAQICSERLSKGRLVYVEGRIHNHSWESNGQKHYKTEIIASDMLLLDSRYATESTAESTGIEAEPARASRTTSAQAATSRSAGTSSGTMLAARPPRRTATIEAEADPEELPF